LEPNILNNFRLKENLRRVKGREKTLGGNEKKVWGKTSHFQAVEMGWDGDALLLKPAQTFLPIISTITTDASMF